MLRGGDDDDDDDDPHENIDNIGLSMEFLGRAVKFRGCIMNGVLGGGDSKYLLCSPRKLGKMNPFLTIMFFSNGLVQPPTR